MRSRFVRTTLKKKDRHLWPVPMNRDSGSLSSDELVQLFHALFLTVLIYLLQAARHRPLTQWKLEKNIVPFYIDFWVGTCLVYIYVCIVKFCLYSILKTYGRILLHKKLFFQPICGIHVGIKRTFEKNLRRGTWLLQASGKRFWYFYRRENQAGRWLAVGKRCIGLSWPKVSFFGT